MYAITSPGYGLVYLYLSVFVYYLYETKLSKIAFDQRKAKNISSRTYVNLTYDNLFENHNLLDYKAFRISQESKIILEEFLNVSGVIINDKPPCLIWT